MLKREREKLTRMVKEYVLAKGGRVTEEGRRLMEGGEEMVTPDYLELPTKAGPLSIIPYGNWLACRFQDVKAAVSLLRDDPAGSHLNPYSGKFNFHFGRCTADEALEEFTSGGESHTPRGRTEGCEDLHPTAAGGLQRRGRQRGIVRAPGWRGR